MRNSSPSLLPSSRHILVVIVHNFGAFYSITGVDYINFTVWCINEQVECFLVLCGWCSHAVQLTVFLHYPELFQFSKGEPLIIAGAGFIQAGWSSCHPANSIGAVKLC